MELASRSVGARPHRGRRGLRRHVAVGLALLAAGCGGVDRPRAGPFEQPYDVIYSARYGSAAPATTTPLPASSYRRRWFFRSAAGRAAPPAPPRAPADKLDSTLAGWIARRPPADREELVITFADTVRIPRFPVPDPTLSPGHPVNVAVDSTARAMRDTLAGRRAEQYLADTLGFGPSFQAVVLETYWLVQAAWVEMPLGNVMAVAARPEVLSIRPNRGRPPPTTNPDARAENDVICARATMGALDYAGLPAVAGRVAILDTGVDTGHELLCGRADRFCMVVDCVNQDCSAVATTGCSPPGNAPCLSPHGEDRDPAGHGTSSAAILSGNGGGLHGNRFEGLAGLTIDSFTIYGADNKLRAGPALAAMQLARLRGNTVVLAEMGEEGTGSAVDDDAILVEADKAYDTGFIVIAPNGNYSSMGIAVPAVGRRVLGVGSFDSEFRTTDPTEASGQTSDLRIKPDILAPSNTETAGGGGSTDYHGYHATSGAAPYAAGAAWLLRNWMGQGGVIVDPGQVYAHLILSGDRIGPFGAGSTFGAGFLLLPPRGMGHWGKVMVSEAVRCVEIPITVGPGSKRFEAAIWWPEKRPDEAGGLADTHNDIDLQIRMPPPPAPRRFENLMDFFMQWFRWLRSRLAWFLESVAALFGWCIGHDAESAGVPGVFERARIADPAGIRPGTWQVVIRWKSLRVPPQDVFWGVSVLDEAEPTPPPCP